MNFDALKERLDTIKNEEPVSRNTEWNFLIGELTDFLNLHRGKYGPWGYKFVGQKVGYILKKGGYGDLRFFIDKVKKEGSWFFWYTVKPKPEKNKQK